MNGARSSAASLRARRAVVVTGTVQGVGFRPFVHGLAEQLGLSGFARNSSRAVLVEVEGAPRAIDTFVDRLRLDHPPLAVIEEIRSSTVATRGESSFRILPSAMDVRGSPRISPDAATCDACLSELFDPGNRRYRYPFINCTNCGPRFTIVESYPYDRTRTTMAHFVMCGECREEYENPTHRRFHAQPNACAACGPTLRWRASGARAVALDALQRAVLDLQDGRVGAIKGLGGYHLACDASNNAAVATLRGRKQRDHKPLALMVADVPAAERLAFISSDEKAQLFSPERPIVLLRKRVDALAASDISANNSFFGVMLPYTPLHHLLLRMMGGAPLVMTSGNVVDEPIAFEDDEAFARLGDLADFFLSHDRPIRTRCDDSVVRVTGGRVLPLRRSRGFAPRALSLGDNLSSPTLAMGAHSDATFALGDEAQAVVSHHLGDLDHYQAYRAYIDATIHYRQLFGIEPQRLVHDLHPDYASTRLAREWASQRNLELVSVQHHHAHIAACMAEHGLTERVIGVAFDGTGYGHDSAVWGGELFVGDRAHLQRVAHLRYVGMPGGEQAIREPWRMAFSHLMDAQRDVSLLERWVSSKSLAAMVRIHEALAGQTKTSSVGRLFDTVASMLGLRQRITYEGQAAIELESLASISDDGGCYPFELLREPESSAWLIDTRPTIVAIADEVRGGTTSEVIARRFQSTVADVVVRTCDRIREETNLEVVVLSGGVFCNALLVSDVTARLSSMGFRSYCHRVVPPTDGGLSYGQLAVIAARDGRERCASASQDV